MSISLSKERWKEKRGENSSTWHSYITGERAAFTSWFRDSSFPPLLFSPLLLVEGGVRTCPTALQSSGAWGAQSSLTTLSCMRSSHLFKRFQQLSKKTLRPSAKSCKCLSRECSKRKNDLAERDAGAAGFCGPQFRKRKTESAYPGVPSPRWINKATRIL